MPYPSPGCQTCKIRRIKVPKQFRSFQLVSNWLTCSRKCDETKPVCRRCAKSERVCLDANTVKQRNFLIHDEGSYASGKVKRPRGPRTSLTTFRPYPDLQSRALEYYVNYHLRTVDGLTNIASCLPESVRVWNLSGRICRMVNFALSAMALAVFSRTQRHPQAAIQASANYDRVLQIAQGLLAKLHTAVAQQRLQEQHIDACLLTTLILGRYEDSMHHPPKVTSRNQFNSLQSWLHHDGAMAILKVWMDDPNHGPPTRIITQARRGLIKSCLIRNLPLPQWIQNGGHFGEDELELEYDRIAVRIVNLRQSFAKLLDLNADHEDSEHQDWLKTIRIEKLNQESRVLDQELQNWTKHISTRWSYKRQRLQEPGPWPKHYFFSPEVYCFSSICAAAVWCQYFAARMIINSTRLRILGLDHLNSVGLTYESQRLDCKSQLNEMAHGMASTIPFCLDRFKLPNPESEAALKLNTDEEIKPSLAGLPVWPLVVASSLEGVDIALRQWFRYELGILGRVLGDGVLANADQHPWVTL